MSDDASETKLKTLSDAAKSGLIGRRRFMEGAAALGLTVSAASTLWSQTAVAATPRGTLLSESRL